MKFDPVEVIIIGLFVAILSFLFGLGSQKSEDNILAVAHSCAHYVGKPANPNISEFHWNDQP